MFPLFFFSALWIGVLGPGINEHGIKAVQDKGAKPAFEAAWEGRKPYDALSLKGTLGNFGNP
jgi:hypothetical protein